jgi:hypothetical protein
MTKPAQSRASVSIGTTLSPGRVLELAEAAAQKVRDDTGRVRVQKRTLNDVDLSLHDLITAEELMRFTVEAQRAAGRTTARTAINRFQTKEGGVASLVPMGRRKLLGFSVYTVYMDWLVSGVLAEDPQAIVTLVTGD